MRFTWWKALGAWRLLISKLCLNQAMFFYRGGLRIIVGAPSTAMPGWIPTEYLCVDITDIGTLNRYLKIVLVTHDAHVIEAVDEVMDMALINKVENSQ